MSTATLRRSWRPRPDPDPLNGIRPLQFYADANELDVDHVHVFPADAGDRIALSFITGLGSVNITLPLQLAREIGAGLVRLAADNNSCASK
jgi:hypothetical protein